MSSREISRRFVVGALGTGVVAAAVTGAGRAAAATKNALQTAGREPDSPVAPVVRPLLGPEPPLLPLVAPLRPGARLGRWVVQSVAGVQAGALSLTLADQAGQLFQLDVCRRDEAPGAQVPPGRSDFFDIYLANRGDGSLATREEHGLCAMALADVIRHNEQGVDRSAFSTLAERLLRTPDEIRSLV